MFSQCRYAGQRLKLCQPATQAQNIPSVFDDQNIPNKYVTPLSSLLATLEFITAEGTKVRMQVKESEEEGEVRPYLADGNR